MDDLLSLNETAALLAVSEPTVRRWVKGGVLLGYRVGIAGRIRVYRTDALRMLTTASTSLPRGDLEKGRHPK